MRRSTSIMDGEVDILNERITINVGGVRHETFRSTLRNFPDTRLAWVAQNKGRHFQSYDSDKDEYFFDRNPTVFAQVLNYYRTGSLHSPSDTCGPLFEEELQFWGIDEKQMEPCCWARYTEHRDAQENLKVFDDPLFARTPEATSSLDDEALSTQQSEASIPAPNVVDRAFDRLCLPYFRTQQWKRNKIKLWLLFDDHRSSLLAKVLTAVNLSLVVLSVISMCIHSVWIYAHGRNQEEESLLVTVFSFDVICCVWFTFELIARFILCPNRWKFITEIMNWIDFVTLVSYFTSFISNAFAINEPGTDLFIELLTIARLLRLFRFFRLSTGLQILRHTLIASSTELLLLLLLLMIPVTIFATIVYFCERKVLNTKFKTIPESFWWAIITMTTVGYGDMAPKTTVGKIFGSLCAACSVFILALPVSIIGNNFSLFYSYAQARLKLPKKSHNAMVGAANVLVCDSNRLTEGSGSDQESDIPSVLNVIHDAAGDVNIAMSRRYRRERLSLYAGGLVRAEKSRDLTAIESTEQNDKDGVDSETETDQDALQGKKSSVRGNRNRSSNVTQITELSSGSENEESDTRKAIDTSEFKRSHSVFTSSDNVMSLRNGGSPPNENGSAIRRASTPFRFARRWSQKRCNLQKIHPIIPKTIVTQAENETSFEGSEYSNEDIEQELQKLQLNSMPTLATARMSYLQPMTSECLSPPATHQHEVGSWTSFDDSACGNVRNSLLPEHALVVPASEQTSNDNRETSNRNETN